MIYDKSSRYMINTEGMVYDKIDLTRTILEDARLLEVDTTAQINCGFAWKAGMLMVFTGRGLGVAPSQPEKYDKYDHRLFAGMLTPSDIGGGASLMVRCAKHVELLYTKLFTDDGYDETFKHGTGVALGPRGCAVPIDFRDPLAIGRVLALPSETDPYLVISCVPAWG